LGNAFGYAFVEISDDSGDALFSSSASGAFDNTPHSIAVTDDGTIVKLYVDGRLDASGIKTAGTLTLDRATFGAFRGTTTHSHYTGVVYSVSNFQRALAPAEIAHLHEHARRDLAAIGVTLPAGPAALRRIGPGISNGSPILIRPGVYNGALT
jgi:hypothetical protein